jgi:hypothetical protein
VAPLTKKKSPLPPLITSPLARLMGKGEVAMKNPEPAAPRQDGWEIKEIRRSERSYFFIIGVNHDAQNPIDREFRWHVQDISNDRYWLSPDCIGAELAKDKK